MYVNSIYHIVVRIVYTVLTINTPVREGCILYMWNNEPAIFPIVTNEAWVHHEGPLIALAQLLVDSG